MASFYCEKCQAKVPAHLHKCPNCGLMFDAVRCPECKYTGNTREFKNGCPVCGYLAKGMRPEKPDNRLPDMKHKSYEGPSFFLLFSGIFLILIISVLVYLFM